MVKAPDPTNPFDRCLRRKYNCPSSLGEDWNDCETDNLERRISVSHKRLANHLDFALLFDLQVTPEVPPRILIRICVQEDGPTQRKDDPLMTCDLLMVAFYNLW